MSEKAQTGDWADYKYVVKEDPHDVGNWFLQCCPKTRELDAITEHEELHLHLPRGTSYEKAQEIRRMVQENIPIIKMAHFRK